MIYLIITTSINNKIGHVNHEHRKQKYISCIETALKFVENRENIIPIIVENNSSANVTTYLENFGCDIVYTDNNKLQLPNKGGNEMLDIQQVIKEHNIHDDDIVIKLTGRYKMLSDHFFNLVQDHVEKHEAFIKFFNVATLQYLYDDCVLGLFAIKCKYLKRFQYNFSRSPECEFASFIRNNIEKEKILEIMHMDLECCFADDLRVLVV
jgi:hypothetical protein